MTYPTFGKKTRQKAFSLVELLVVVGIVALLCAMLFPVMAKSREKARQATCSSALRQLSTALQLYVNDNNETWPADETWSNWAKTHRDAPRCPSITEDIHYPDTGVPGYAFNLGLLLNVSSG